MNVPVAVGVPLRVMVLLFHVAATPAGSPVTVPMPVAPVVAIEIFGDNAVLMQSVGLAEGAPAVLEATTLIVPVAFTVPQPPVSGME